MSNYTPSSSTFNDEIYIYNDTSDIVIGGLLGTSNVPIKQLADNTGYLKNFKGNVIRVASDPTTDNVLSGYVIDSNTDTNTLVLNTTTGSWFKRNGILPTTTGYNRNLAKR